MLKSEVGLPDRDQVLRIIRPWRPPSATSGQRHFPATSTPRTRVADRPEPVRELRRSSEMRNVQNVRRSALRTPAAAARRLAKTAKPSTDTSSPDGNGALQHTGMKFSSSLRDRRHRERDSGGLPCTRQHQCLREHRHSRFPVEVLSDVRTAISCCRPVARARSKFATLAQAISKTKPAAPIKIQPCRLRASCLYQSIAQRFRVPRRSSGDLHRRDWPADPGLNRAIPAVACATAAPGLSRP